MLAPKAAKEFFHLGRLRIDRVRRDRPDASIQEHFRPTRPLKACIALLKFGKRTRFMAPVSDHRRTADSRPENTDVDVRFGRATHVVIDGKLRRIAGNRRHLVFPEERNEPQATTAELSAAQPFDQRAGEAAFLGRSLGEEIKTVTRGALVGEAMSDCSLL